MASEITGQIALARPLARSNPKTATTRRKHAKTRRRSGKAPWPTVAGRGNRQAVIAGRLPLFGDCAALYASTRLEPGRCVCARACARVCACARACARASARAYAFACVVEFESTCMRMRT